MSNDIQIQLAKWIERLRLDPFVVQPFADWLQENGIRSQQLEEAAKLLYVAHSAWICVDRKKRKFFGASYYFTKFKVISVIQKGFSYTIKIHKRNRYKTNNYIKVVMRDVYKDLTKPVATLP